MKFTYYDQTVDLLSEEYLPYWPTMFDRVVVKVSGGLDSASLLFLLCKYFPKIKKHIFTGDDVNHPFDAICAENVVEYIMKKVPNHNIESHDILPFDDTDPKVLEEVALLVKERPEYYNEFPYRKRSEDGRIHPHKLTDEELFYGKIAKPLINERNVKSVVKKYNCERNISGMTMNPPNEEMVRLGFDHLAEKQRNEDRAGTGRASVFKNSGTVYQPLLVVNKLFVKYILEKHNILDEIFPLTASCTGGANITKLWTKPCEECFWCYEKKWAFGSY